MRRPRSKLQVTTFPFLAVLLCAMGSLMLLLFIMDRRAKIAAQHAVAKASAERKKRTEDEEQARQAEWEKAKEALRQSLQQQENQLLVDVRGVQQAADGAKQKLVIVQAEHQDLQERIQGETKRLKALQMQIDAQRASLSDAEKKDLKTRAELLEATRELADLEKAFQAMLALRAKQKHVYSVVPYHGKQGDTRTPVYVECLAEGLLFHPEKKLLDRWTLSPDSLRREVESRSGPLAFERTQKEKSRTLEAGRKGPYVLFLIRPEGIANYYKAQAGLKGYELDFGYEVVDSDWVLDFQGDPNARPAQSVASVSGNSPQKTNALPPLPLVGGNGGSVGEASGNGNSPGGHPGLPLVPPASLFGGSPGVPGGTTGGVPAVNVGTDAGLTPRPSAFVPISRRVSPVPVAVSEEPAGTPGIGGKPAVGGLPTGTTPGSMLPPGGKVGDSPSLPPLGLPIPGSNVGGSPASNGGSSTPGGTAAGSSGGTEGAGAESANAESGKKSMPSLGSDSTPKSAPAPTINRQLGSRDFVITIDCFADHVSVFPTGLQYKWTAANAQETDRALVQAITNLISRRQASVRPGEAPYRPVIRFQVAADGLRTYLRAYPLLEHLRIPMTRENVED